MFKRVDINFIFDKNREVKALPKYFSLIATLHIATLLIPEVFWESVGFDVFQYLTYFPKFIQYYVHTAYFHNSMFVFWLVSPGVFVMNTFLFAKKVNTVDYSDFLIRRANILKKQNKAWSSELYFLCLLFLIVYIWGTFLNLEQLDTFPRLEPTNSRISMMVIHGGSISLFLPMLITFLITEIRAILNHKQKDL